MDNGTYFVVKKLASDDKFDASESNATFYVNKVTPVVIANENQNEKCPT